MKTLTSIIFCSLFCITINAQDKTVNFPKMEETPVEIPKKENLWFFIMAGQSNMTGRGFVEPQDTITNPRVFSINNDNKLILAKEPLAYYSAPNFIGLDCGLSFGKELLNHVDSTITIVVINTAVGGSSTDQWINDELHRGLNLMSNFKEKVAFAQENGILKGILWHQGESDAHDKTIPNYKNNILKIFNEFRASADNSSLPIFVAELGSYFPEQELWDKINTQIHEITDENENMYLIKTNDFEHKGDSLHFNSAAQRLMGKRFVKNFAKNVESY